MDKIAVIKTEAEELIKKIINNYTIDVSEENDSYHITIKTEEAPTIIGRHGETIRAIQKILEVIFYKTFNESLRVLVNINDYREKQQEKIDLLTSQYVNQVKETKQAVYLKDLSSYERKMIHQYVTANCPDLTSYSVGEGRERQLVINLKENAPTQTTE